MRDVKLKKDQALQIYCAYTRYKCINSIFTAHRLTYVDSFIPFPPKNVLSMGHMEFVTLGNSD